MKRMVFPQFQRLKPLGFSNSGYINTHCLNGGWNPRDNPPKNIYLDVMVEVWINGDRVNQWVVMTITDFIYGIYKLG